MASMSVFRVAVLSRVATLTLMFAFDALVDDYDTSGALEPEGLSVPASFACRRLEGVVTWDSVYFARVASEGYEHEQAHAFFPLLPALMRLLAFGSRSRCALAARLLVSNLAHVASAVALERLGTLVLRDPAAARTAATLFASTPPPCSTPPRTPSLCSRASPSRGASPSAPARAAGLAALAFALACAARSNGALNLAFLAHDGRPICARRRRRVVRLFARVGAKPEDHRRIRNDTVHRPPRRDRRVRGALLRRRRAAPRREALGYRTYCAGANSDGSANRRANVPRPWCDRWTPFPNIYAFVQSEYWNVGFLRYYQARQLQTSRSPRRRWARRRRPRPRVSADHEPVVTSKKPPAAWMLDEKVAPYLVVRALMAAAAALVMHVQVATRFLSTTPAPYWFLGKEGAIAERRRALPPSTCGISEQLLGLLGTAAFPARRTLDLVRDGRDGRDGRDERGRRRSRSLWL